MTEKEYNQAEGVRRTDLWRIHDSPEKYLWFLQNPPEQTPAFIFGSLAHKMLLEPDGVPDEYAVAPNVDRRTKAGKEAWEQFIEQSAGKTVVTAEDMETAMLMANKAESIPLVKKLLSGKHEVPFFWDDPDTGIRCKVRLDAMAETEDGLVIADYKTAANARTEVFNSKIFDLGYSLQSYMYTEAVMRNLNLTERPRFMFIAQEKKAPFAVNVIEATEDVILAGMDCFRELIGTLKICRETGYYWGYNGMYGEPNEAFLPGWMTMGEEE